MSVYVTCSISLGRDKGPWKGLLFPCLTGQCTPAQVHPRLKDVPETIWVKSKHDVVFICGIKSDFRPRQMQYPLKPEAVKGIRPVFDSLLKAGIIVPCPDSPVHTPIFPVKKARKPPQPDEWQFMQDLQAVNAAMKQCAPDVPNPYTILGQVTLGSQWFSVVDLANVQCSSSRRQSILVCFPI